MLQLLTYLIDIASGVLAVLPFLILLEIMAYRLIPSLPLQHLLGDGLLCLILAALLSLTGVPGFLEWKIDFKINLIPFSDISAAPMQYFFCFLLFLLPGFILALLYPVLRSRRRCILYGFLLSFTIELLRIFSVHSSSVDHLIVNTAGIFAGYALYMLICRFFPNFGTSCQLPQECLSKYPSLKWEHMALTASALAGALILSPVMKGICWHMFSQLG